MKPSLHLVIPLAYTKKYKGIVVKVVIKRKRKKVSDYVRVICNFNKEHAFIIEDANTKDLLNKYNAFKFVRDCIDEFGFKLYGNLVPTPKELIFE